MTRTLCRVVSVDGSRRNALDFSTQARMFTVPIEPRRSHGLTYLFLTHDRAAVRHVSDRSAVLRRKIVEIADSAELCARPLQPYTQGAIATAPVADPKRERSRARSSMLGKLPSLLLHSTRCPIAIDRCTRETPALLRVHETPLTRFAACHRSDVASTKTVSA